MDRCPSLNKFQLLYGQAARNQFSVDPDGSRVFRVINMRMRFMVLFIIRINHFDGNIIKPT